VYGIYSNRQYAGLIGISEVAKPGPAKPATIKTTGKIGKKPSVYK
jgi:hypothetical protein